MFAYRWRHVGIGWFFQDNVRVQLPSSDALGRIGIVLTAPPSVVWQSVRYTMRADGEEVFCSVASHGRDGAVHVSSGAAIAIDIVVARSRDVVADTAVWTRAALVSTLIIGVPECLRFDDGFELCSK